MLLIHGNIINLVSNFQSALTSGVIPKPLDARTLVSLTEEKPKKSLSSQKSIPKESFKDSVFSDSDHPPMKPKAAVSKTARKPPLSSASGSVFNRNNSGATSR